MREPVYEPPTSGRTQTGERLLALDVFRGLTVAGMLLVNNPGTWSAIYPPLQHAPWHGWTPTDLIFPFFLFIVGVTTHLSLSARHARGDEEAQLVRQIVTRGLLIVLCGLLLAAFPYVPLTRISEMRYPGVLQRIGVAYMAAALLTLRTSWRQQLWIIAALLIGYWALMTLVPVPGHGLGPQNLDDPSASLAAWIDRTVFGNHLWRSSKTWDPEGLLSTAPAIGTVMLGVLAGQWIGASRPRTERLLHLFGAGCLAMVAGLIWHWAFPINKNLWSSSYVLFTGGMAAVTLATCTWLIDVLGITRWTPPFRWYGMNPMIAFLGSGIMARLMGSLVTLEVDGERVPLQGVIYDNVLASWLSPRSASLLYAVNFVLVWAAILGLLYRKRLFFKV
ncbi:MAG: acyltransferase family protein [Gemmatimonadaceae bacterium]